MISEQITNSDICGLIITYNPSKEFYSLAKILSSKLKQVIIIDNNSLKENKEEFKKQLQQFNNILLVENTINKGIATALNQGFYEAEHLNYKLVLSFDQDSILFNHIIDELVLVYNASYMKKKIAFIGVNYEGFHHSNLKEKSIPYVEYDVVITSGALLAIAVFKEIGKFRDDFFIDSVDFEICLRAKKNGYHNIMTRRPCMKHKAGQLKTLKIGGFTITTSNHSAFRRFYMAKNHVKITKEYFFSFPFWILKKNFFFIKSFVEMLIVDNNRKAKINSTLKGLLDGIKN